jgi:hypothetical protein
MIYNAFQNPQISRKTLRLCPEQSTLVNFEGSAEKVSEFKFPASINCNAGTEPADIGLEACSNYTCFVHVHLSLVANNVGIERFRDTDKKNSAIGTVD